MLYTLDTNVIAEILKGNKNVLAHIRMALGQGHSIRLNAICYFEAKRVLIDPLYQRKRITFDALVQHHGMLPLDQLVLDEAAQLYDTLRKAGSLIEDADILVAATALVHNAILVTNNTRHLVRIRGLQLEDWEISI
jgi:tRNA(fMet)-specific endonuclease VapC